MHIPAMKTSVLAHAQEGRKPREALRSQAARAIGDDRHALREVSGRPLLGVINMIATVDTTRKNRKRLFAYALSFMSLLGTFGVLILLQLFMARAA